MKAAAAAMHACKRMHGKGMRKGHTCLAHRRPLAKLAPGGVWHRQATRHCAGGRAVHSVHGAHARRVVPQVQFLGAVTKQQPFMIVTEYMTGGSMADLFKGARFPNLWRAVQIALDMARGMAYLHSRAPQAVIHRDLKVTD